MVDDDLASAIDRLYQLPLEQFTAERNALAATLKKDGSKADAERVKALVKPNTTAWALNQVWWRDRPTFKAMLDAGAKLRDAHQARAAGKAADIRELSDTRQRAVHAVVDAVIDVLGGAERVSADAHHRLLGTIEALASGGATAEAPGRLTADLQSTGLDMLSALAGSLRADAQPGAPPRPVIVSRRPAPEPSARKGAVEDEATARARAAEQKAEAKAHLASRQAALREAEAEASAAAKAEKKAHGALDDAAARVADLEQALDAAREEERTARRALAQATKAASETEMVRVRTVRDVADAKARLDRLS